MQNLKENLKSVTLQTATSKKTNNEYTYLQFEFLSGYKMRVYPNTEQLYIIQSMPKSTSIPVKTDDDLGDFIVE